MSVLSLTSASQSTTLFQLKRTTPPSLPHSLSTSSKSSHNRRIFCSSLRTPTPVQTKDEQESSRPPPLADAGESLADNDAPKSSTQFRGCKTCGREELEKGCNGEGRIQGGIATVPGFGWWPIKAFRPCPGFVASGGRYRRRGQSMDEVAFGRGQQDAYVANTDAITSKNKGGPKEG